MEPVTAKGGASKGKLSAADILLRSASNTSANKEWKYSKKDGKGSPFGTITVIARAGLLADFRSVCNEKGLSPFIVMRDFMIAFMSVQKRIPLDDMVAFENGWVDEMLELVRARESLYLVIREKMAKGIDIEEHEEELVNTLLSDQRRLESLELAFKNGEIEIEERAARPPSFKMGDGRKINKMRNRK